MLLYDKHVIQKEKSVYHDSKILAKNNTCQEIRGFYISFLDLKFFTIKILETE